MCGVRRRQTGGQNHAIADTTGQPQHLGPHGGDVERDRRRRLEGHSGAVEPEELPVVVDRVAGPQRTQAFHELAHGAHRPYRNLTGFLEEQRIPRTQGNTGAAVSGLREGGQGHGGGCRMPEIGTDGGRDDRGPFGRHEEAHARDGGLAIAHVLGHPQAARARVHGGPGRIESFAGSGESVEADADPQGRDSHQSRNPFSSRLVSASRSRSASPMRSSDRPLARKSVPVATLAKCIMWSIVGVGTPAKRPSSDNGTSP